MLALSALPSVSFVRRRSSAPFGREGLGVSFVRSTGPQWGNRRRFLDRVRIGSRRCRRRVSCCLFGSFGFLRLLYFGLLSASDGFSQLLQRLPRLPLLRALHGSLHLLLSGAPPLSDARLESSISRCFASSSARARASRSHGRKIAQICRGQRRFNFPYRFHLSRWWRHRFCFLGKNVGLFIAWFDDPTFFCLNHNRIGSAMGKILPHSRRTAGF